jgi:hypothetical protein
MTAQRTERHPVLSLMRLLSRDKNQLLEVKGNDEK